MVTVLVVEDEIYARKSLVKQIQEYAKGREFRILEAENGETALELARVENPNLIMTDIRMPKMDGLELLKRIKEWDGTKQVVMLSAYSEFEYARGALLYGAIDYLLKPISDAALGECLNKFLHQDMQQKRETVITGQDTVTRFIMQKSEDSSYRDFIGSNLFRKIFGKYQVLMISFGQNVRMNAEQIFRDIETMFHIGDVEQVSHVLKQIWVLCDPMWSRTAFSFRAS